ncbi:MAG: SDR family NAD(P)-dependent oxidoreductase [archaeon]
MPTALITGSSKGLGKFLALEFAKAGYNLIIHGRNAQLLDNVKQDILRNNVKCDVIIGEITSTKTIDDLYNPAKEKGLDILVNNVGAYSTGSFQEMDIKEFEKSIDINLLAPARLMHKMYELLKKSSGLIININSIAGKNPNMKEAAYCAGKHGLRGLTTSLTNEANNDGIRMIDYYLGAMNTDMTRGRPDQEKFMDPKEVAKIIYRNSKEDPSVRTNEITLARRKY